jgi:hypothetical protein
MGYRLRVILLARTDAQCRLAGAIERGVGSARRGELYYRDPLSAFVRDAVDDGNSAAYPTRGR